MPFSKYSPKQKKLARVAAPRNKITGADFKKLRKIKLNDSKKFYKLLFKFGYKSTNKSYEKIKIYKNFQRRFRPQIISSTVDQESYAILKSLI